jgi:prepilin-type N-terminal cleavage/methylation domain-containing protein
MRKSILSRPCGNQGFSLIELGIVLTIAGVIIGAIWFYAAQANDNVKREKLESIIVQILTQARQTFSTNSLSGSGDITDNAVIANIFPAEVLASNSGATASGFYPIDPYIWNGAAQYFDLSYATSTTTGITDLYLDIPYIPNDACTFVLSTLGGNSTTVSQLGLMSYSDSSTGNSNVFAANPLPTPVTFANFCAGRTGAPPGLYLTIKL